MLIISTLNEKINFGVFVQALISHMGEVPKERIKKDKVFRNYYLKM